MLLTGETLRESCEHNTNGKVARDFVKDLTVLFQMNYSGCYCLQGIVGTGKTTGILMAIEAVGDYSNFQYSSILKTKMACDVNSMISAAAKAGCKWLILDNAQYIVYEDDINDKAKECKVGVLLCSDVLLSSRLPVLRVGLLQYHEMSSVKEYMCSSATYDSLDKLLPAIFTCLDSSEIVPASDTYLHNAILGLLDVFIENDGVVYGEQFYTPRTIRTFYNAFISPINKCCPVLKSILKAAVDIGLVKEWPILPDGKRAYVLAVPGLIDNAMIKSEYLTYLLAPELFEKATDFAVFVDDFANLVFVGSGTGTSKLEVVNMAFGAVHRHISEMDSFPYAEKRCMEKYFTNTLELIDVLEDCE